MEVTVVISRNGLWMEEWHEWFMDGVGMACGWRNGRNDVWMQVTVGMVYSAWTAIRSFHTLI